MTSALEIRSPLLDPAGARMLQKLREHPDAPKWNHLAGDRINRQDIEFLDRFREALHSQRGERSGGPPPEAILQGISSLRHRVEAFRRRLPENLDLEEDWERIPTLNREDIATASWEWVPDDADLDKMIVYRTAGTTGHPLFVPHAPRAAACYLPLIETALHRYGLESRFDSECVACFLIGAQVRTVTYPTVLSGWNGAGFAKLNLHKNEWPGEGSAERYFQEMNPRLFTGDPISFSEMLSQNIPASPIAMITTAVAMSPRLRERISGRYSCPVLDWYSLTETGPIGYLCTKSESYHVLPHDIHVEALRPDGSIAREGERGEITVSGGRNPFLPLLRYRTGDYGRLDFQSCPCGDPMPRILDLEGREPVLFRSSEGTLVNPVDLSRILRKFCLVQHEFTQREDLSCHLSIRPLPGKPTEPEDVSRALRQVLGDVPLDIHVDAHLGDRKVIPYQSELLLEE